MTKEELVIEVQEAVSELGGGKDISKKAAGEVLDRIFAKIQDEVQTEGRFVLAGFGTFVVRDRKPRKGKNLHSGAIIDIPASRTVAFKPAPSFKKGLGVPKAA